MGLNGTDKMKICVIGQGYIGLPTAILLAKNNFEVLGVDINEKIISNLNKGIPHIEEPGIDIELKSVIEKGNYSASLIPMTSDAFIITVPTPYIKEDKSCNLNYVISACESIIPYIKKGNKIIIESTISPLSMDNIIKPLFEDQGYEIGEDLFLAHCPERVLPGNIFHELVYNNRIIGGITPNCNNEIEKIYGCFVKGKIIKTEAKTAELSKCMENTFRDVNIALANELVKICTKIGINALEVISLANKHPRVNIHAPGPGVGGHCLAIDPYFIIEKAPDESKIISLARNTNTSMPDFVVENVGKILKKYNENNCKIAILGVAYKGNIDDDRESPAYDIIEKLKSKNFDVDIYDPHVKKYCDKKIIEVIENSSLILILTDHDEFKSLNYCDIKKIMKKQIIFDTKNILDYEKLSQDFLLYNYGNLYSL